MVPKINVYLSDELAEAVREAGIPVSAICQRALEQAVARIATIRETVLDISVAERFAQFTKRAGNMFAYATDQATAAGSPVLTTHILAAILDEKENLALGVLRSMEIEPERLATELATRMPPTDAPTFRTEPSFDPSTVEALRLAATESIGLGHNYIGSEHLLLGLVAEPTGAGGQILRSMGADLRLTRRAVSAALAGYMHLHANAAAKAAGAAPTSGADVFTAVTAALDAKLAPLIERIERLESAG